jgi:hypothetical protein
LVIETRMDFKVASIIGKHHWLFQDFHSMNKTQKQPACNIFHFISASQVKNMDDLLHHGTWSNNFVHNIFLCVVNKVFLQFLCLMYIFIIGLIWVDLGWIKPIFNNLVQVPIWRCFFTSLLKQYISNIYLT